jgi:hypothetical protein
MELLPGNTDLSSYKKSDAILTKLDKHSNKKAIILATNDVNDTSLFLNGLTQNIVILYDMFESIGYKSYLLSYNRNNSEKKDFIKKYDIILADEIIKNPIPIHAFIEIGMSLNAITRSYLRSIGAKIIKLYLGNIINIDIETIQNFKSVFFYHHLVGEIDEIWVSPHYKQHLDYAALLNRTDISNSKVVPYVWDSCFLTQYENKEAIQWIPPSDWKNTDIVIMDPNISFQKCFLYSLLLVEAFSKKYPEWNGNINIINGDKTDIIANAKNFVLPSLSLFQNNRIKLYGRKNIHTILKENRSACFITHQWNNDFNYMTLELMYCNYPILHNSEGWDIFGYHYDINKWNESIETLYNALINHKQNLNIYKTHAANLIWKHSIHNPEIQSEWKQILLD